MKTRRDEEFDVTLMDPEFSKYDKDNLPFFDVGKNTATIVGGITYRTFPDSEGAYILRGHQLTRKNLRTWRTRLLRIINGKPEPFRVETMFGYEDYHLGSDRKMWSNVMSGGKIKYRGIMNGTPLTVLGHVQSAIEKLGPGEGVQAVGEDDPEEIFVSTGGELLPSLNGINLVD